MSPRKLIVALSLLLSGLLVGNILQRHYTDPKVRAAGIFAAISNNTSEFQAAQDKALNPFTPTYFSDQIDDDGIDDDTIDSILKFILYSSCILLSLFLFLNIKGTVLRQNRTIRFLYSSRIIFLGMLRI